MIRSALLALFVLIILIGVANASNDINFHVAVDKCRLHPGDEVYITLFIENEGTVSGFYLNGSTAAALQLVTTAKDLRVKIDDEFVPIEVESTNPVLIGDLPAGRVARAIFKVKVDENAELGEYRIPVELRYTKVTYSNAGAGVIITYSTDCIDTEYITINITKRDYDFSVKSITSNLKTNHEGVVTVVIQNTGLNKICNAILILNTSPPLIVNPKAMSAYLGNLNPGETAKASFKVYVSQDALNQTYPATLILKFRTTGEIPKVLTRQIGLKVIRENLFEVLNVKSFITKPTAIPTHGSTKIIPSRGFVEVTIKANEDMKDATAILSFDNREIQVESYPYLGNLKKGEIKQVLFYVRATAPIGAYRACLVLKYRNKFGDEVLSEKHYFKVVISSSNPLRIVKVVTKNVGVGLRGDLVVSFEDSANETISDVTFFLISPDSTIVPISPSYFIFRLKPKEIGQAKFRVLVSGEAVSGFHRLYLLERYDLGDAEDLVSVAELPVFVRSKISYFEVLSVQSNLYPDETGEVIVKIKNAGSLTAYNAIVKLELSPPLTIAGGSSLSSLIGKTQPGLYFIGSLKPNQTAVAKFRVHVDKDAGPGSYPVNIVVEYYDNEGYRHISNPITVSVVVKNRPLITPLMATAIVFASIGLGLAIIFAKRRIKREKG